MTDANAGDCTTAKKRRVATYERVSSEDQRERETIKTQTEELVRHLGAQPEVLLIERYQDDGVSGTIPFATRPGGARLLKDAAEGFFDEVWVYRLDRLGRDDIDPLLVRRELEELGVTVNSVIEGHPDLLMYAIHVAFAAQERRSFLQRSAGGMNRAAREGRYLGGPPPLGYRVDGQRSKARLVPSDVSMWGDFSEAEVVRLIFRKLAEGNSCSQVAREFQAMGVPTASNRDGIGVRRRRTQQVWRPNRIYSIATNPVYRGEQQFGRRSKKSGREIISAKVPPLVSDEVWYAAQDSIRSHRLVPTRDERRRVYLLKGVMRCALCGWGYYGATSPGRPGSYRCGGQLTARRLEHGRCPGKGIRCDAIDPIVWDDIERFVRDPGDLLDELAAEVGQSSSEAAVEEAERIMGENRLEDLSEQRRRALDLHVRGHMQDAELEETLQRIEADQQEVRRRLSAMETTTSSEPTLLSSELLTELHERLDSGLTESQMQEIAQLLVRSIIVHTDTQKAGRKKASVRIEYAFPCVVPSRTDNRCTRCPA